MYLENVFLYGGTAPVLPDIFASEFSEGSESAVDNRSMFSDHIIAFSSVRVKFLWSWSREIQL